MIFGHIIRHLLQLYYVVTCCKYRLVAFQYYISTHGEPVYCKSHRSHQKEVVTKLTPKFQNIIQVSMTNCIMLKLTP